MSVDPQRAPCATRGAPLRAARAFGAGAPLLAALALASGCAAVLGLEETTARDELPDAAEAGPNPTPVEAGPSGDASADGADASVDVPLALAPATLLVRRGGTATFTVTLTRAASTPATVTVGLADLPPGVTATTATLAAGQTSALVTVTASAGATVGAKTVRVVSTSPPLVTPSSGGTATLLVAADAGSPDVSFDGDGVAIDATKGLASAFYALAVQADGRILAGGVAGTGGWLLRRFDASGAGDTAFAAATTSLPLDGEIRALGLDAAGRIYAVGTSSGGQDGGAAQLTVARVLASGAIDSTFGTNGVARLPAVDAPGGSSGRSLAVDDAGVYAAGARVEDGGTSGLVLRLQLTNGARDLAWNGGKARILEQNRIVGLERNAEGRVTVGGTDVSGGAATYYLARLEGDGGLDPTFGTNGTSTFQIGYRANAFTRLASGTLVLVGDVSEVDGGTGAYTGALSTQAGASIFAPRSFGTAPGAAFYAVAPVGNAGFVAAGHASGPNGEARVTRILTDGGVDPSFSVGGTAILDPGGVANGFDLTLFATVLQPDGRLLVAGNRSGAGAVIYRLWP